MFKLKLLELHLAIAFTKFFIRPNFICTRWHQDLSWFASGGCWTPEHCSLEEHMSLLWTNVAFHSDPQ